MDIETFKAFRAYDFKASPTFEQTFHSVLEQYLIVLSERELPIKEEISNGVLNVDRITREDKDQLELQTKCFIFCQETGNILDLQEYKQWVENGCIEELNEDGTCSYDEIVDMIVNNKPVPGIKEIPDTVLDHEEGSERVLPERKKPWER